MVNDRVPRGAERPLGEGTPAHSCHQRRPLCSLLCPRFLCFMDVSLCVCACRGVCVCVCELGCVRVCVYRHLNCANNQVERTALQAPAGSCCKKKELRRKTKNYLCKFCLLYKPELSHLFNSEMFERMGMRLSHEISKSNRFVCQISNNSAYLLYKNLFDFILYTFTAHQGALLVVISIFGLGCGSQGNANYTKLRLSKSLFLYMFHWRQMVFSYYMYFHL